MSSFLQFTPYQGMFLGMGYCIITAILFKRNSDFQRNTFTLNMLILSGIVFGSIFYPLVYQDNSETLFQRNSILISVSSLSIVVTMLYSFRKQVLLYANNVIQLVLLLQCFGKIGCYFSSCCLGAISLLHLQIPLQFFEATVFGAGFLAFFKIERRLHTVLYLFFFSTTRIFFEVFRQEDYILYFGMPAPYYLILLLVLYSSVLLYSSLRIRKDIHRPISSQTYY